MSPSFFFVLEELMMSQPYTAVRPVHTGKVII